jgi:rSAM/selenodomain-associated transferase 1
MAMARASPEPITIGILAKASVPGQSKTRLAPRLGEDGAAALQARLIARTVATARDAGIGPVTLWCAPDISHPVFQAQTGVSLARQPDGDLGHRMLMALGPGPALVIGTDCPALRPAHLIAAAEILRDGGDAVVIPVKDGGYVLIGMRQPDARLFDGVSWSTDTVMAETRRRLARLGLCWREPARLWDVDRPEDLERMTAEGLGDLLV